jgi:hypothetical protein
VNAQFGGKNRDLLFMRARVLLKMSPPKKLEARKNFSSAFDLGQRKPEFFGMWYDTELALQHFEPAVGVATAALDSSVGSRADWFRKRAYARLQSAVTQDKAGDIEHTKIQLKAAAEDLTSAVKTDESLEWDPLWKETIFKTHDSLWSVSIRTADSLTAWTDALETQLAAERRGDHRIEIYSRFAQALEEIEGLVKDRQSHTNLLAQRARWCLQAFEEAPRELRSYREFRAVKYVVDRIGSALNVSIR